MSRQLPLIIYHLPISLGFCCFTLISKFCYTGKNFNDTLCPQSFFIMKIKAILFIVGLIGLILFQSKLIMPLVYDVASSDLFLEDNGDDMQRHSENTKMTEHAFRQCNAYVSEEYLEGYSLQYSAAPINAFSIGNYQYVINANIEISPADAASFSRLYVCRIKYDNGSDNSGVTSLDNWSVDGISGLDNID